MPYNRTETALTIAQDVAGRMGLPAVTSLTDGTQATATQLLFLLNEVGPRLMAAWEWQRLERNWAFSLTPAVTTYALPEDFDSFIDDTMWNTSTRLPLIGPASAQEWATITARNLGGTTFALIYKIEGDQLVLYYSPATAQDVSLDYRSRSWAQASGAGAFKDKITDDGDEVLFDPELVKSYLKLRFLEEKGLDTIAAKRDFDSAMQSAKDRDKPAPTLQVARSDNGFPLITPGYNLPDTNYGV